MQTFYVYGCRHRYVTSIDAIDLAAAYQLAELVVNEPHYVLDEPPTSHNARLGINLRLAA